MSETVIREVFAATPATSYHITAVVESHWIEFRVVKITALSGDNVDVPLFGDDHVEDPDRAEAFWQGSIKWDGCSNWNLMTDGVMAHFCGREDAMSIGPLMGRLYDLAATHLTTWDSELAA